MSDRLLTAHRLIQREAALRSAGSTPAPGTVEKTIAFVTEPVLLHDGVVRNYLLSTAEAFRNDYFIAAKLLDTVLPLVKEGFPDDALDIYKKMVHFADPEVWYSPRAWGANILAKSAFTAILEH